MCSEIFLEDLKELVEKMMKKRGIGEYKLEVEGQTEAGDNYTGEIIFFNVTTKNDGKTRMVMKTTKREEFLRNMFPVENLYTREISMYTDIFPAYCQLLEESNVDSTLDFVPKLHFVSNEKFKETLIFENLKSDGYKMLDRTKPWNLQHSLFVMEHYGKLHALSMALKHKKPEVFRELSKHYLTTATKEMGAAMDWGVIFTGALQQVMEILKKNGREDLVAKYDGFLEENLSIINGEIDENDKYVIFHGDAWNNNFMFKYKDADESKPSKVCFLDFQLSAVGTPIYDLGYNIFASCDASGFENLDLMLKTYYESLSRTLKNLRCNPDDILTFDQLMVQWKKYAKIGVFLSILILRILLTTKEEVEEMRKVMDDKSMDMKSMEENLQVAVKDKDGFERRVMDIFTFYGDNYL